MEEKTLFEKSWDLRKEWSYLGGHTYPDILESANFSLLGIS